MGICHRIIVFKCKDKICFQNQLVTEICIQLGFLWKSEGIRKIQNAFDVNDTWQDCKNIWAESPIPYSTQPEGVFTLSELDRRMARLNRLKKKNNNPHNICCILKGICVDSEPPLTPLNLTCPSCWQGDSVQKSLFLSFQLWKIELTSQAWQSFLDWKN